MRNLFLQITQPVLIVGQCEISDILGKICLPVALYMFTSYPIYVCQLHHIRLPVAPYMFASRTIYVCQLHHICLPVALYLFASCTIYVCQFHHIYLPVAPYMFASRTIYMFASCTIYVFWSSRSYRLLETHLKRSFISGFLLKIPICALPQRFDEEKQGAAVD